MTRTISGLLVLIMVALTPAAATAQAVVPEWTKKVKLGQPVFVTTVTGEMVEGDATGVTPDNLVVLTPAGPRTLRLTEIQKVQRRDATWTGAAIAIPVGMGLVLSQGGSCGVPNCDNYPVGGIAFYAATFGAIGWGIDALVKGRSTVFDRSRAPKVSLMVGPKAVGARASISW